MLRVACSSSSTSSFSPWCEAKCTASWRRSPAALWLFRYRGQVCLFPPVISLSRAATLALALVAASPAFSDAVFRQVNQDVTFNPSTGATSGRASIEVEAVGSPVSIFYTSLDLGLRIDSSSAPVTQTAFQSWNVGTVTLSPPLAAGARRVVDLAWSGTLRCTVTRTTAACDLSPGGVTRVVASSALVAASAAEPGVQRYPQDVTLRLPTGTKVVGTGEVVSDTDDGSTRTTRFRLQRSEMSAQTYFFGATAVPLFDDGGVRVTPNHAPNDAAWAARLPGMFDRIVPWLQQSVGAPLPYADVQLVKLAPYHRELGYTAPTLINLSAWLDDGDLNKLLGRFGEGQP